MNSLKIMLYLKESNYSQVKLHIPTGIWAKHPRLHTTLFFPLHYDLNQAKRHINEVERLWEL